ncbi:hypothetical protein, partial [Phascolarctobacterium sp.]|uniref:hypothetical protein n=1 Tax=Phascolarctobacterium sp. TaxID=2049039 RepID=UPI002A8107BC
GSAPEAIIDYSTKPQDFIMRFELNKKYLIKRQGEEFNFEVSTGRFNADKIKITWDKLQEERSSLRVSQRVPYLIYVDGLDYIYLYEERSGTAAVFDLNGRSSNGNPYLVSDNGSMKFLEEPTNPKKMLLATRVPNIGYCYAAEYYHVSERGKPKLNNPDREYIYVAGRFREPITLLQDVEVEIAANENSREWKKELLPAGTKLTRFRTLASNDTLVELLLPDKRVARFHEHYLFSEPRAYLQINGFAGRELFDKVLY